MSDVKVVAASIVSFLKRQLDSDTLSADSRESVEVGVQCIETAFELTAADASRAVDLLQLVRQRGASADEATARAKPELAAASCADAERFKNEGNELMKAEKHQEALEKYSRAIAIDPCNAVYFCNRAAAHFKLAQYEDAVANCTVALELQPDYAKAHSRLGLALAALDRNREARAAFARAAQLEPDNEAYKQNLRLADEKLAQRGERPPMDLAGLLHNPALLNMASEMLADPNMQNLISGLMSNTQATAEAGGGGMSALLEAGQALAQHMQAANPDLVDQLRRQVRPPGPNPPPAQ